MCQFCGANTSGDRPGPGACPDRGEHPHVWLTLANEWDEGLLVALKESREARGSRVEGVVMGALREKWNPSDVEQAKENAGLQLVGGGSWGAILEDAEREARALYESRTIVERGCDRCGLPGDARRIPGSCRVGQHHEWRDHWTPEEHESFCERRDGQREVIRGQFGDESVSRVEGLLADGLTFDGVRAELDAEKSAAAKVNEADESSRNGQSVDEPAGEPDEGSVDPELVFVPPIEAPAKRGRGRPRKEPGASAVAAVASSAPAAQAPVIFDGTNHRSWEGKGPPPADGDPDRASWENAPAGEFWWAGKVEALKAQLRRQAARGPAEESEVSDDLWCARSDVLKIEAALDALNALQDVTISEELADAVDKIEPVLFVVFGRAVRYARKLEREEAAK